ncbi:hypothetical protein B0H10DRAFT_2206835 [Mycena sp. CBHHK59/15]|nr:hypothetical protein B0H10DRAFT_2206835 [Mycena sp. CBHHK59/15]
MATESTPGIVDRVQNFVAEHKTAILIGTGVAVAIGGAAYYASTSSSSDAGRDRKDRKKGSNLSKKRKSVKDADGPILEERKPKGEPAPLQSEEEIVAPTLEELETMSTEYRSSLAASFKTKGNAAYSTKKFADAAQLYTLAIEVSPKPEPVFYSNRAACYVNMTPPKHELVVQDCDEALKLDPNYVKALNRRAMALEGLHHYVEALRDFTAATILDKFTNQTAAQSVERVLKKISGEKSAEILSHREPRLPSFTFISAYFAAFRTRPPPYIGDKPTTGDSTLLLALEALEAENYPHAVSLINEALAQDISFDQGRAEALNLRGTFKFLTGDIDGAKADLQESIRIVPAFTQSLVKVASVHMEQGDPAKAFECFDEAIRQNPDDPDIYYHRGQVLFIMGEFADAAENYTKSTDLDDQFVFSHIQLAVAQYKNGNLVNSMGTFRRTLKAFPTRSEPQNYYGELLLDQQRFPDAVEKFERAVELEKLKSPPNVLPLVNKGLALYQWKQDIGAAERCCNEALRIDPECEAAVATLAQLSLQQGRIEKAVEMFARQAELARSEPELASALTYQYASSAQLEFMKNYPTLAAELRNLAQNMG